jgi:DNA invertase Pin-like site-specific DNA recombinase
VAVVGYARVSTALSKSRKSQHVDNQVTRLYEAGCAQVFTDEITGTKADRPGWRKCQEALQPGDTFKITKLDRIGRSLTNLVDIVTALGKRGVNIVSLDQGVIDTTSPQGKLLFGIMAVIAEWESDIVKERTIEGLEAARERHGGKLPTRGPSVSEAQIESGKLLAATTDWSAARIAEAIGISRATLYRHIDVAAIREQPKAAK